MSDEEILSNLLLMIINYSHKNLEFNIEPVHYKDGLKFSVSTFVNNRFSIFIMVYNPNTGNFIIKTTKGVPHKVFKLAYELSNCIHSYYD